MVELIQHIFDSIIFVLPLWCGNAAPTILGGGAPIDGGRYWRDGRRVLGDGKTIRGFWMGTLTGSLIGGLLSYINPYISNLISKNTISLSIKYEELFKSSWIYNILEYFNAQDVLLNSIILGLIAGAIMTFGGLTGDLIGSFIKRRSGIERGHTFIFLDQLGFLILGMTFIYPLIPWPIEWILILVPTTFITHIAANLFGYFTGIQDDPL